MLLTVCTGDGGAVEDVFGKLIVDGGLSKFGEGTITELSSMNFRSELSIPRSMSYVFLVTIKLLGRPELEVLNGEH